MPYALIVMITNGIILFNSHLEGSVRPPLKPVFMSLLSAQTFAVRAAVGFAMTLPLGLPVLPAAAAEAIDPSSDLTCLSEETPASVQTIDP